MPIYPAGQGVNGLLCPRFLLGCVWLSPSCMCWMLASSSMYCILWLLCPVYRIAGKCDRIATTLENKQKQSMTIKQENDVSSALCTSIESTKAHSFHALGAGGREFESRHSDHEKSHNGCVWNQTAVVAFPVFYPLERREQNGTAACFSDL